MSWDDAPSEAQLGTVFSWLKWEMDTKQAQDAVRFLQKTATRREVSREMNRIKELKEKRLLSTSTCFKGKIWEGFGHD